MAEIAGAPVYFVHLSCAEALEQVQEARSRQNYVYAETCPHYLTLDDSMYDQEGFEGAKYVLTPPLRDKGHQEELWKGLRRNDLQVVSTDHCAFRFSDQKTLGVNDFSRIPNGGPGIENRLGLLYTHGVGSGLMDLNRLVELLSTNPARLFGLFLRKGTIAVGSDADIVVFDPDAETVISARTHHMNVDYNLDDGMRVKGVPEVVIVNGRVLVEDGEYTGIPAGGRFLRCSTQ